MAIRVREVNGHLVALCAAETKPEPGDLYLDDTVHHALNDKFYADYLKMGFIKKREEELCDVSDSHTESPDSTTLKNGNDHGMG
ncbi:MAG: hypothetical protein V3V81_08205 [Candidatus Bathyarchaeia archaeon]